jgi:hypothetical protein
MKNLLGTILLLAATSAFGQISDIVYPAPICPTDQPKFTVYYRFAYGPSAREEVAGVKWQFIQNGTVFKTLNSSGYTRYTPIGTVGEADIYPGNLPTGNISVKVTIVTIYVYTGGWRPMSYNRTEQFMVGLGSIALNGPSNFCPGATELFIATEVANAESYTWQVPYGWRVNGIQGPVVSGQGSSVSVTSSGYPFSTQDISVSGVSSACGPTPLATKTVTLDYPFSIEASDIGVDGARFSVNGPTMSSYAWDIPYDWFLAGYYDSYVDVYTNGISGTVSVTVLTQCGNNATRSLDYIPTGCNSGVQVYPTYAVDWMNVDAGSADVTEIVFIDDYGNYHWPSYQRDGYVYMVDTSGLPYGQHILHVTETNGCVNSFRIFRTEY